MNVIITDKNELEALPYTSIQQYLSARNWRRIEAYGDFACIYRHETHGELIVPNTNKVAGYARVVADILKRLSHVEKCDQITLYRNISEVGFDVIRLRVPVAERGTVPIQVGMSTLENALRLMKSAVHSTDKAEKFAAQYGGVNSTQGKEFLSHLRLGQTEQGSFVLPLLSPISNDIAKKKEDNAFPSVPYSRQVTKRLTKALKAAQRAIQTSTSENILHTFLPAIAEGVSVNLCKSLSAIIETTHDLDISVSWATSSPEKEESFKISFSSYDGERLKEAAKVIEKHDPKPNIILQASVTDLHRDPEENGSERITIKAKMDGKEVKITAKLDEYLYRNAVIAHQHNTIIHIKGTLLKNGKKWIMENVIYLDHEPYLL